MCFFQITVPFKDEGGFYVLYVFDMLKKIAHVMDPRRTQWNLLELERQHARVLARMLYGFDLQLRISNLRITCARMQR